jgi:hypothetical protein
MGGVYVVLQALLLLPVCLAHLAGRYLADKSDHAVEVELPLNRIYRQER